MPGVKIVILGSGATFPTSRRNLPSTAILKEGDILLFDCGEGTQIQLRKAKLRTGKLKAVFISHMHGDHVTGLVGLLMTLEMSGRSAPLSIFGPEDLEEYISCSKRLLRTNFSYEIQFGLAGEGKTHVSEKYYIESLPLDHRISCFGYAFCEKDRPGKFMVDEAISLGVREGPLFGKLQRGEAVEVSGGRKVFPDQVLGEPKKGVKVAYCMDTVPCKGARELAYESDVLIYDGTFGPDEEYEAMQSGHSTVIQGASLARESEVKKLLLTHISPRYEDELPLLEGARHIFPNTDIARDLMEVET
jgi:ribonuclease Z